MLISFTSRRYYFVEKIKIVEKQLCKLIWSYALKYHMPLSLQNVGKTQGKKWLFFLNA